MNPNITILFLIAAATAAAVLAGVQIAHGNFGLVGLAAAAALVFLLNRVTRSNMEAPLLAFLLVGYIIGNRGFAQLMPIPGIPLFFGELVLVVALVSLTIRTALRKESFIKTDYLSLAIVLWIAFGAIRLLFDIRNYDFFALRDFAMVYYALFFFVAYDIARQPRSFNMLWWTFAAAVVLLVPAYFVHEHYTFQLYQSLSFGGIPLILMKKDLIATSLAAGVLMLLLWRHRRLRGVILVAAALLFLALLETTSRAAFAGLLCALVIPALARQWFPHRFVTAVLAVGIVGFLVFLPFSSSPAHEMKPYVVYERAVAMFDPYGLRSYASAEGSISADNNRFRLQWWRSVATETRDHGLIFGLGFGYDIAREFVLSYYGAEHEDEFTARSPHNFLVTVFGRMGTLGLLLFGFVVVAMGRQTWAVARAARQGQQVQYALALWSMAWVFFVSACFGVVLEGPMGAIPFWILLGMAMAATCSPDREHPEHSP